MTRRAAPVGAWFGALLAATMTAPAHATVFGCDPTYLRDAYGSLHREVARDNAIYAMLANNVYDDARPKFRLPASWRHVRTVHAPWGLAYAVWKRVEDEVSKEAVLVFRGTEDLQDWLYGDLTSRQYKLALEHIRRFIEEFPDVPRIATGHSLGGGLALFASYRHPEITAIGFNASPRLNAPRGKLPNPRLIIYEKDEFAHRLNATLTPWRRGLVDMGIVYKRYDFLAANALLKHNSYPLARGLLLVGALESADLRALLERNCDIHTPEQLRRLRVIEAQTPRTPPLPGNGLPPP